MKKLIFFSLVLLFFFPFAYSEEFSLWSFAVCDNDGMCDSGEDKCTCSNDCGECTGDVPNESCKEYSCLTGLCRAQIKYYCCGNHICESGEDFSNCEADCAPTELTAELLEPADENVFMRGDEITFRAKVKADGIAAKNANVRVRTFAGDIPMYDDGNHSDAKANDGIYGVSFLVSELTGKDDYSSEIYAEKLGVTTIEVFTVKVDPSLEMDFSVDKNNVVLGNIIFLEGTLLKRGKPVSAIITLKALNKGEKIFESKTRSDENGFFSFEQRTSLIYPEGKWHLEVSGSDNYANEGLMEKSVLVSKEAGTIFMDVAFSSDYDELYNRGQELKILADVSFDEEPVDNAEVKALLPNGKEAELKMVSLGKYSLSYMLPFDFPLGEQTILINAKKTIGSVKYGGSNKLNITIDNAKINAELLEPKKQIVALGEELNFRLKLNYANGNPLSNATVFVKINDETIAVTEKEKGIFYFSYIVVNEKFSEARQLLLTVEAVDSYNNSVSFSELFEVTGELTLEYYFRENPLLFLSVIFSFVFIILVLIILRKRMNKLGSLNRRKKELERLKSDLQEKYFNLGSISNEQYYSLLSQYSTELRDIESAIEAFKKASEEKGEEIQEAEEESDVFGKKETFFDDKEMRSMFKVKGKEKSHVYEEEEVPGLFSFPKTPFSKKGVTKTSDQKTQTESSSKKGVTKQPSNLLEKDLSKQKLDQKTVEKKDVKKQPFLEKKLEQKKEEKEEKKTVKEKKEDDLWE